MKCSTFVYHALVLPLILTALGACGRSDDAADSDTNRVDTVGAPAATAATAGAAPLTSVTLSATQIQHGAVRWEAVTASSVASAVEVPAQVVPDEDRTSYIGAPAQGRIVAVSVHPGQQVTSGQPLVTLQSPEASSARADYEKARAQLTASQSAAAFARAARERADRLLVIKAASRQEAERAKVDEDAAQAALQQARAEVTRTRGLLAQLGAASPSGAMVLRSPIAGIVLSRDADPGTVAEAGAPLVAVTDSRHLWLSLSAPDRVAATVRPGARVRFSVPAFPGDTFVARVEGVGGALDTATRMVPIHGVVESGLGRLRPAMFATAWLEGGAARSVVVVPSDAVQLLDERQVVFVARPDGKGGARFERRDVTTGPATGGKTQVLSGIAAGDVIVVAGAFAVKSEFSRSKMAAG